MLLLLIINWKSVICEEQIGHGLLMRTVTHYVAMREPDQFIWIWKQLVITVVRIMSGRVASYALNVCHEKKLNNLKMVVVGPAAGDIDYASGICDIRYTGNSAAAFSWSRNTKLATAAESYDRYKQSDSSALSTNFSFWFFSSVCTFLLFVLLSISRVRRCSR